MKTRVKQVKERGIDTHHLRANMSKAMDQEELDNLKPRPTVSPLACELALFTATKSQNRGQMMEALQMMFALFNPAGQPDNMDPLVNCVFKFAVGKTTKQIHDFVYKLVKDSEEASAIKLLAALICH